MMSILKLRLVLLAGVLTLSLLHFTDAKGGSGSSTDVATEEEPIKITENATAKLHRGYSLTCAYPTLDAVGVLFETDYDLLYVDYKLTWKKAGLQTNFTANRNAKKVVLIFSHMSFSQDGIYKCTVIIKGGTEKFATFTVAVKPESTMVKLGYQHSLTCEKSQPKSSHTVWKKGNAVIAVDEYLAENNKLYVIDHHRVLSFNVTAATAGTYSCFESGERVFIAVVAVPAPPVIKAVPRQSILRGANGIIFAVVLSLCIILALLAALFIERNTKPPKCSPR